MSKNTLSVFELFQKFPALTVLLITLQPVEARDQTTINAVNALKHLQPALALFLNVPAKPSGSILFIWL